MDNRTEKDLGALKKALLLMSDNNVVNSKIIASYLYRIHSLLITQDLAITDLMMRLGMSEKDAKEQMRIYRDAAEKVAEKVAQQIVSEVTSENSEDIQES